jgi:hypothetical protein
MIQPQDKNWPPVKTDQLKASHISSLKADLIDLVQYVYFLIDEILIFLMSFQAFTL